MSKHNRTRRSAMLSTVAFALAFGAYAQDSGLPRAPEAPLAPTAGSAAQQADLDWMVDWLEAHGRF